jgi:hypothetical protein
MSENLKRIRSVFDKLKGQMVISGTSVYRLIGIMDDGEDYYYSLYNGREIEYHSCVGSIVPLKGFIEEKHYNEMIRIARLNHFDQETLYGSKEIEEARKFNEAHKQSLVQKLGEFDIFLEGPYWELN